MAHSVILLCPEPLGYENRETAAQSIEPSGHKKHQRTCASDRRQSSYADELPRYDRICYIIKLLKDIAQKHRNHKSYDQFDRAACRHVMYLIVHICPPDSLFFSL